MPNPVTDLEERQAWDQYVAALLTVDIAQGDNPNGYEVLAMAADKMLAERRRRFGYAR